MRFQYLAVRLALAALVLAALAAVIAVAGVRLGLMPYQSGLILMVPAVALGVIALLCALAWMASALKHNKGVAKRGGMIALIGSLCLLWPPLQTVYGGLTAPPVYDAATDPENPPQFVVLAKQRQPGMNSPAFDGTRRISYRGDTGTVNYILHLHYQGLTKPFAFIMPPSRMFWRGFEAAKRMGWTIVDFNAKEGRIEACAASFWFGQVSDIVIRVKPAGPMGARLDIRAQSREGDRDFGRNLALLEAYFHALNE